MEEQEWKPNLRAVLLPLLESVQERLPSALPVRLRVAKLKDAFGSCDIRNTKRDGEHFLISICAGVSEEAAKETLLHEYAHVLAWELSEDDHGAEWGYQYSRIYRAVCE